jgi:hypothetical protein
MHTEEVMVKKSFPLHIYDINDFEDFPDETSPMIVDNFNVQNKSICFET